MAAPTPGKPGSVVPTVTSTGLNSFQYLGSDSIISMIRARRNAAINRYQNFYRRVARWYDLYRGVSTGRFAAFRNNIHIPFILSVIQSDVARKVQTSFGSWPVVEFSGYGPEDAAIARKNETLISAQMKDCESFRKAVDFFLCADMYGTAIARVGWKEQRQMMQWREMGPMGQEVTRKGNVLQFDGPDWDNIDILDFWLQPGKRRVPEAAWGIHRYYIDLDELAEQVNLGMFDRSGFNELKRSGSMPTDQENEYRERTNVYRSFSEYTSRRTEAFAKPVEIWDMWGRVPVEFAPDGIVQRVITLANGKILLRNRPNPFWHGQLPFLAYSPMPDPHYFHGPGKIEVAEKMQFAANRFANQKMDAIDLVIDPMWLVNRGMVPDTQNLFSRAGKIVGIDGPVTDDNIKSLAPDIRGLQVAYTEIAQLWQWIQQGTGIIEDTVQGGAPATSRQTLGEFRGRQENVMTRLMLEARLAEEGFIEPLANMFRRLNQQFLTVPHAVKILGTDAVTNPITGRPMPQEPMSINLDDVNMDYSARAIGATQLLGKQVKQQNMIMLLQAASAHPAAATLVNWDAFFRQIFKEFDFKNVNELVLERQSQVGQEMMQGGPPSPAEREQSEDDFALGGA